MASSANVVELGVLSPNYVVFYDANNLIATLASGATVPIVNFLDDRGDRVPHEEINDHDSLRALAGPVDDGTYVDFGISRSDCARKLD